MGLPLTESMLEVGSHSGKGERFLRSFLTVKTVAIKARSNLKQRRSDTDEEDELVSYRTSTATPYKHTVFTTVAVTSCLINIAGCFCFLLLVPVVLCFLFPF